MYAYVSVWRPRSYFGSFFGRRAATVSTLDLPIFNFFGAKISAFLKVGNPIEFVIRRRRFIWNLIQHYENNRSLMWLWSRLDNRAIIDCSVKRYISLQEREEYRCLLKLFTYFVNNPSFCNMKHCGNAFLRLSRTTRRNYVYECNIFYNKWEVFIYINPNKKYILD